MNSTDTACILSYNICTKKIFFNVIFKTCILQKYNIIKEYRMIHQTSQEVVRTIHILLRAKNYIKAYRLIFKLDISILYGRNFMHLLIKW